MSLLGKQVYANPSTPVWLSATGGTISGNLVVDGTITTMYAVDGAPVDRETFLSYLTPSQREAKRPTGGTITVKIKNLAVVR